MKATAIVMNASEDFVMGSVYVWGGASRATLATHFCGQIEVTPESGGNTRLKKAALALEDKTVSKGRSICAPSHDTEVLNAQT
jgi:hypothetical protein